VATILIISSIVKRLLRRASPLAGGARFYSGGSGPPTGAGADIYDIRGSNALCSLCVYIQPCVWAAHLYCSA